MALLPAIPTWRKNSPAITMPTGQIQAVTPTMVARLVKSSAKLVTQTLASVGFEVEWRWVDINKDNQRVKKRTRAYCISDSQTWSEIISRYYYSEDGERPGDVPEVLNIT